MFSACASGSFTVACCGEGEARKAGQRPMKGGVGAGPEEKVPGAAASATPEAPVGGGPLRSRLMPVLPEARSPLGHQCVHQAGVTCRPTGAEEEAAAPGPAPLRAPALHQLLLPLLGLGSRLSALLCFQCFAGA